MEGYGDDTLEEAPNYFETTAKRNFTAEEARVVIPVPGLVDDAAKGIKRQRLTINAEKMKSLLEPVITSITMLVKAQLRHTKDAKAVILVGGFGQPDYLRNCIQKVVGDTIEVLQPPYGWTAVVRGALIRAIQGYLLDTSRIEISLQVSRKANGLVYGTAFSPYLHQGGAK